MVFDDKLKEKNLDCLAWSIKQKGVFRSINGILLLRCLIFSVFLPFSYASYGQDADKLRQETIRIINHGTSIPKKDIPGYVIGLFDRGEISIFPFNQLEGDPPLDQAAFGLGGLSAVFMAWVTEILEMEGQLHKSELVNKYLPENYQNPASTITIQQLLTHTSGLPYRPTSFGLKELDPQNPFAIYNKQDLLSFYQNYTFPKACINPDYHYTELNFAFLEVILEHITQIPYRILLDSLIFKPLGLKSSGFHCLPVCYPGYSLSDEKVQYWEYQSFEGALGLKSNILDLMHILEMVFSHPSNSLLQSFWKTTTVQAPTQVKKQIMVAEAWHVLRHKRRPDILLLGGSTNGHTAFAGLVPSSQTAVIILASKPYNMDGLGLLLLRLLNHNWK